MVSILVMSLASCTQAPATPTPLASSAVVAGATPGVAASATVEPVVLTPTLSPAPTQTTAPTPTAAPIQTTAPTERPTQVVTATSTASPSVTSTPPPKPTTTLASAASPGPAPSTEALLAEARHHQHNGRYDEAIAAYQALLDQSPPGDVARQAQFGLAQSAFENQDYAAAAATWEAWLSDYPDAPRRAEGLFMTARAYRALNLCAPAIDSYTAYMALETDLADMAYEAVGDCQALLASEAADPQAAWNAALDAYSAALAATANTSVQVGLREKRAGIHLAREAYDQAVAEYDAILAVARIESYRARIEYQAGQALELAGDVPAARARYQRAVTSYPDAEFAYFALIELVDAGVPVDEFQRGMIDYYAGAAHPDAYGAAVRAFDRYLAQAGALRADEALYHKALAQRGMDDQEAAIGTLDTLTASYPDSDWTPKAWLEKAAALAALGDRDGAIKVYRDTTAFFPQAPAAQQSLWRAARLLEGAGRFDEAADLFQETQASFPAHEDSPEALWRAGLSLYRAGQRREAVAIWRSLLDKYPTSAFTAKTRFWVGKLTTPPAGAAVGGTYWDALIKADPREYYALRAAQVRSGEDLTTDRLVVAPVDTPAWDRAAVEREVLPWLRRWTQIPDSVQSLALSSTLAARADVRRGEALLGVGLRRPALAAYEDTLNAVWDQPLNLARFSVYFYERGLYGLAARAATRLAALWPNGNLYSAPPPVQRLAYPLAYADLLSAEALDYELDPLLLAALIRQESLFEKEAESWVGARGLGQVMPATGEGIARTLKMTDFELDHLYRPWVSVRFGAFYLSVQLDRFDNELLVGLAAYNGGPGNTLYWIELTGGGELDLDLFVEVITAGQSRIYLQRVYAQYLTYEALYRSDAR